MEEVVGDEGYGSGIMADGGMAVLYLLSSSVDPIFLFPPPLALIACCLCSPTF